MSATRKEIEMYMISIANNLNLDVYIGPKDNLNVASFAFRSKLDPEHYETLDVLFDEFVHTDETINLITCYLADRFLVNSIYTHKRDQMIKLAKKRLNDKYGTPKIDKVIFNYPATIVFWKDGSKTVVKAQGDEPYDKEKGLAMAICKKMFGNDGKYYDIFKEWCPEETKKPQVKAPTIPPLKINSKSKATTKKKEVKTNEHKD